MNTFKSWLCGGDTFVPLMERDNPLWVIFGAFLLVIFSPIWIPLTVLGDVREWWNTRLHRRVLKVLDKIDRGETLTLYDKRLFDAALGRKEMTRGE